MRKVFSMGIISALLAFSCKTMNTSASSAGSAKSSQSNRVNFHKLKGTWQITSVDYGKDFKVKPFDEGADAQCFVGSEWKLVPNNYSGSYSLNGVGDCPAVFQPIKFEVVNGSEFKFKKIATGTKAKQNLVGYSLSLSGQSDASFSLVQNVTSNAGNVRIIYNFARIK
ncbi:MAG: hypothetical protein FDW93_03860 [Bergeyella sp.]|nr:hypothetical protein [Bergeyella sp.]